MHFQRRNWPWIFFSFLLSPTPLGGLYFAKPRESNINIFTPSSRVLKNKVGWAFEFGFGEEEDKLTFKYQHFFESKLFYETKGKAEKNSLNFTKYASSRKDARRFERTRSFHFPSLLLLLRIDNNTFFKILFTFSFSLVRQKKTCWSFSNVYRKKQNSKFKKRKLMKSWVSSRFSSSCWPPF